MNRNDYDSFIEKFKIKKTTDECYTPPEVYEAVKNYVCNRYGINPAKVVRPFYPGGDYKSFHYSDGAVVIDNPPFSILEQICNFYLDNDIPFFMFAPSLTVLSGNRSSMRMNHIICDSSIIYDNGAIVKTSFVTSYGFPNILESSPELTQIINSMVKHNTMKRKLPRYEYPLAVLTAAMVQKYSRYGIDFAVKNDEAIHISALDIQRAKKKRIFGSAYLLSDQKSAERKIADQKLAESGWGGVKEKWKLSKREQKLIESLSLRIKEKGE